MTTAILLSGEKSDFVPPTFDERLADLDAALAEPPRILTVADRGRNALLQELGVA